ncbi:MAG: TIGR04282 family arsenosugar biosynthesis glycosyltransferase [Mycobacteriales bacterium]
MTAPTLLVVAKAPVPGQAKTRLAANIGYEAAAQVAAAALLDTLEVVAGTGWPVVVAMTGDLTAAALAPELAVALAPLRVVEQRGTGLGERLAAAHSDADAGHGVVQVGMDTPHLDPVDLQAAADALRTHDAALGMAEDGGWWLLAVRHSGLAQVLADVPMSIPDTGTLTLAALQAAGAEVAEIAPMTDVDTWYDADDVARTIPGTRFAAQVDQSRRLARTRSAP